ncbi:cytochrome P450 monooxygenase-like protein [Astrocystis sublimbata]|nr:cytochrome P450 monooxygenase-like protein [Astrocystis sublimbata]
MDREVLHQKGPRNRCVSSLFSTTLGSHIMADIGGSRMLSPAVGALALVSSVILYYSIRAVYLLFFHPLAKYPGPKLAALTELWSVWALTTERLPFIIDQLHKKHGDVVRVGPNELSFATAEAFHEIHGHVSKGKARFLKTEFYENDDPTPRIVGVRDPEVHARQRKSLSHAFSTKSLREQEEIVQKYVDGYTYQLARIGENGKKPLNVAQAFNWLTFDIIGDLAFGESFGGVEKGETHVWVKVILDSVVNAQMTHIRRKFPLLDPFMPYLMPEGATEKLAIHRKFCKELSEKRLQLGDTGRDDFFSHMLSRGTMSVKEMMAQSSTLIIAGSETTATTLSALTYYLLKNPACMKKLQDEVRGAFTSVEQVTGESAGSLPYLHGVIEEAMRLFPPAPFPMPRHSPGAVVDGHYVPAGTVVSVSPLSMTRDARYWQDPQQFRPERWVGSGFNDQKKASQPFSTGSRACLGVNLAYLELHIAVAKMVLLFDWELAKPQQDWVGESTTKILWNKADLMVKYHPRVAA